MGLFPQDPCLCGNGSNYRTRHDASVGRRPRRTSSVPLHEHARMYANGNKVQRAQAANPDPISDVYMNVMAEPIDSPENMDVEVVMLVINRHHRKYDASNALQRVKRYLARECIKPTDWSVCDIPARQPVP